MIRKRRTLAVSALASSAFVLSMVPALAAGVPYQHIGTVNDFNGSTTPPDNFNSFDISWVDNLNNTFYLADRANNALDAVDADDGSLKANAFVGKGLFAGNYNDPLNPNSPCAVLPRDARNGPNGVWTDDHSLVYAGDGNHTTVACNPATKAMTTGDSSLKVLNADTNTLIADIDTGGVRRTDEGAFGRTRSGHGRVLVGNPAEDQVPGHFPFEALINTDTQTVIGKIVYDQKADVFPLPAGHGYDATGFGLEQPVWDPEKQAFLLNVPGTVAHPGGEVDVISAEARNGNGRIVEIFDLVDCAGTGIAVSGSDVVLACSNGVRIINHNNGQEIRNFPDMAGADEIWYNPGDRHVYAGETGKGLGILDLPGRRFLGNVGAPAVPANGGTHSVAAESKTNRIFLPINNGAGTTASPRNGMGGIAMFHHDDAEPQGRGGDDD